MTVEATVEKSKAPLEDLMVAMDVVDTVRHRDLIVDRELDAGNRRARLIERLRSIYAAQGIEVTDQALEAGVDALEEQRFSYTPTPPSFSRKLAHLYVRRDRWLKPLIGMLCLLLLIWAVWMFTVRLPQLQQFAALPNEVNAVHQSIVRLTQDEASLTEAGRLRANALEATDAEHYTAASALLDDLRALESELELDFELRIVSRPNSLSGVWRVPDVNTQARNYYLIVEAVQSSGQVLSRRIRNEENGRYSEVTAWGVRVSEETFESVAADKRDDGIIQAQVIGRKARGNPDIEYLVPTSGATITEW